MYKIGWDTICLHVNGLFRIDIIDPQQVWGDGENGVFIHIYMWPLRATLSQIGLQRKIQVRRCARAMKVAAISKDIMDRSQHCWPTWLEGGKLMHLATLESLMGTS